MTQLRDIKDRIESVKKTRKITQAMKMVAAAKFKRATEKSQQSRHYLHALEAMLKDLANRVEPDALPELLFNNNATTSAIIIVTGDRGLCGGYNTNIIKFAQSTLVELGKDTALFIIGSKGFQHFNKEDWSIVAHEEGFIDSLSFEKITAFISPIVDEYLNGTYRSIDIIFNEFASVSSNQIIKHKVLPIQLPEVEEDTPPATDFIYDTDKYATLTTLLREYLIDYMYNALLETQAAEQSARMAAMDAATENALDMIKDLTLVFNRKRQAQITSEISEIVAGAEALVS